MKQYEFNFQMVSGGSTLVQFQAVHEIRALHYNVFLFIKNTIGNKIKKAQGARVRKPSKQTGIRVIANRDRL